MFLQGIATMVLESPFYGSRKPHYQFASQLQRVSDLLTLGRSTIEESLCLLDWAGRHSFTHLGQPPASLPHLPLYQAIQCQCITH